MIDKINQLNTLALILIIIGFFLLVLAFIVFKKNKLKDYLKMKNKIPIDKNTPKIKELPIAPKKEIKIKEKKIKITKEIKDEVGDENTGDLETEPLKDSLGEMETDLLENDTGGNAETSLLIEEDPPTEFLIQSGEDDTEILSEEEKDKLMEDNKNKDEDDKVWGRPENEFISERDKEIIETHADRKI